MSAFFIACHEVLAGCGEGIMRNLLKNLAQWLRSSEAPRASTRSPNAEAAQGARRTHQIGTVEERSASDEVCQIRALGGFAEFRKRSLELADGECFQRLSAASTVPDTFINGLSEPATRTYVRSFSAGHTVEVVVLTDSERLRV